MVVVWGLIMRRFHLAALAAVAAIGFASVASAADMPVKAVRAPVAMPYMDGHLYWRKYWWRIGYGRSFLPNIDHWRDKFRQFFQRWNLGRPHRSSIPVELMGHRCGSWLQRRLQQNARQLNLPNTSFLRCACLQNGLIAVGRRLGYAVNDLLFYGTGGYASGTLKKEYYTGGAVSFPTFWGSGRANGWFAGLGLEWRHGRPLLEI